MTTILCSRLCFRVRDSVSLRFRVRLRIRDLSAAVAMLRHF